MNTSLRFSLFTIALTFVIASGRAIAATSAPAKRPNVLFILVDDLGWRDFSCYGASLAETPAIDRLASQGVRFTQAYVAYPRCVPSRFGLWTGKYPARFQGNRDGMQIDPARDVTLGTVFQKAGYDTFFCGKWHLGEGPSHPRANGFATTVAAGAAGATRSHFAPYNTAQRPQDNGGEGGEAKAAITDLDVAPPGEYLADRQTDETIKFLRAPREKPFFAVLSFYAVHTPLQGKADDTKHYRDKLAAHPPSGPTWEKESAGENLLIQNNPVYGAMVKSVDENVGRLLGVLDEQQLAGDTIVVLASDNGGLSSRGGKREMATSNRPLRAGKGHLYEGGLRIPLLVRWPGQVPARVEDRPAITLDLFPTLAELARLDNPLPKELDGHTLAPLLLGGKSTAPAPALFWHNPAPRPTSTGDNYSSAVRMGDWKLIDFPDFNRTELYDLAHDVGEARDLAQQNPQKRDELLAALNTWRKSVGAVAPKDKSGQPEKNKKGERAKKQKESTSK